MNTATPIKCEATIRLTCHPSIHPEDLNNAVLAWAQQSARNRRKPTPEAILEDFFLASLANKRPWSEEQVRTIARLSASPDFCERFARALEEGKANIFDAIDVFILSNWRTLTDPRFAAKLPGLNEWNPRAACGLIEYAGLKVHRQGTEIAIGEEWYSTRRKRLGLRGKHTYLITDCIAHADGRVTLLP